MIRKYHTLVAEELQTNNAETHAQSQLLERWLKKCNKITFWIIQNPSAIWLRIVGKLGGKKST